MGKENKPKRPCILWTVQAQPIHFVKNMKQAVSVSDSWLSSYHSSSWCDLLFFFFFPPLSQFHPLFTTTCQHLAAQQQHVFLVQLYGWDSVTNIQLSQDKTTACVMFSIVCSPLGNLLTKTKILFAKFMGVDEKVRWLPGLWCFCHYKKVCSARCVW